MENRSWGKGVYFVLTGALLQLVTPPFSLPPFSPAPLPHSVKKQISFSALSLKLLSQQMSPERGRGFCKTGGVSLSLKSS